MSELELEKTVVVNGNATIGECVDIMKKQKLSAILIADTPFEIDGIFTDRDIFLKIVNTETSKHFWDYPVRLIMSRPVFTLSKELVHLATEYMADHNVRHIPVITQHSDGKFELHGLITQDFLFRRNVKASGAWRNYINAASEKHMSIGIFSDDYQLAKGLIQALTVNAKVSVRQVRPDEISSPHLLSTAAENFHQVILDTDSYSDATLKSIISAFGKGEYLDQIILLCMPDKLNDSLLKSLKKIHNQKSLQVILKPVDSSAIVELFKEQVKLKAA